MRIRHPAGHPRGAVRKLVSLAVFATVLAGCQAGEDVTKEVDVVGQSAMALPELKKLTFGGDFVLTDQNGAMFDTATLRGKIVFLFFGFTTCPDACPMTLSKIASVYALLGNEASSLRTVFVSVDPERDTPEKLKVYLSYYDLPVVGLTGTAEEIKSVAGDYGVYYSKSEEETAAGYLIDHATLVYLIDQGGKLRYLSHLQDSPEMLAGLVRKVLAEG